MALRKQSIVILAVVLQPIVTAGVVTASASAGVAEPTLLRADFTAQFSVRPATMSFGAGADVFITGPNVSRGAFRARRYGHISWTSWNRMGGSGRGLLWLNDCTPSCATGSYQPHAVSLMASRVRLGRFTRLILDYRLQGRPIHTRASLTRIGSSSYDWG